MTSWDSIRFTQTKTQQTFSPNTSQQKHSTDTCRQLGSTSSTKSTREWIFCENKESHQRGSHQLGNKLKQIINHFETLDFIRLNFNDNHVSYLFLGQTWCDICCGPGSHCGPTSTSPSHTFWCDIVLHCLSGQCNKSIKRLTMYWNTLLSSNWLWRTVLVLFKHVLYLFAAIL